jgi:hypothetical protein
MTPRSIFAVVRRPMALVALLASFLAFSAQAHASKSQQSIVQDDRLLLSPGYNLQSAALDDLDALGVDIVHADIAWAPLAPKPNSKSVPKADLSDPKAYRASRWSIIDELVIGAQARGMRVLLTPSTPGPVWATGKSCTKSERKAASLPGSCRPNAQLYGKFVRALARRYTGRYKDSRMPRTLPLPRVDFWSFYNEPNLRSWLYPASVRSHGKFVPISARLYRNLVYAGGNALKATGHGRDEVLLGETGPIGGGRSAIAPVPFYQALFCINSKGGRLKGGTAKQLGCPRRIKRLPVTGVAHHTYTRATVGRLTANPGQGNITIGAIPRLRRVLKQGVHVGAISARASSHIHLTEFGVSSRPPSTPSKYGVSLAKQSEMINLAEYLGYLNSAVRSVTQYGIEDNNLAAGSHRGHLVFQTGLRFQATDRQSRRGRLGRAKPSRAAYRMPLLVIDRGSKVVVWGGVRTLKRAKVDVLNRGRLVKKVTLRSGYFSVALGKRKGNWQLRYRKLRSRVARPIKLR